jgi:hypothetical protein
MDQFAPQSLGESLDSVLGAGVDRLQGNAAVGHGGAGLHDHTTVAVLHSVQGDPGAPDEPEIGHAGGSFEFGRADLGERSEQRCERDVDPDVDGSQCLFDVVGGLGEVVVFGGVDGDRQCWAAIPAFEPIPIRPSPSFCASDT